MIASFIDHTLLKANATRADVERLCDEAEERGFYAVCVNPVFIPLCKERLKTVKVATVCGFPLGAVSSEQKAAEARESVQMGADEIDMVIPIGAAIEDDWDAVERDIKAVREATKGRILKVIIEACLLTDDQKRAATLACIRAGADFIKTSTGFSTGGATLSDVALMKTVINEQGSEMRIKAAGGIRNLADARAFVEAGASRLGTSGGLALVAEEASQ